MFIEPHKRNYYSISHHPAYWDLLHKIFTEGIAISCLPVYQELIGMNDPVSKWAKSHKGFFPDLNPDSTVALKQVADEATAWESSRGMQPAAIIDFLNVADSSLVAIALSNSYKITSHEKTEPFRLNKIKLPDIASALGVETVNLWEMFQEIGATFSGFDISLP